MNLLERLTEPLSSDAEIVRRVAEDQDHQSIWLVGGPVRDALLEREVTDLDFLLERDVETIARKVAEIVGGTVRNHPGFMTATVLHPSGRTVDFTTAREETYERPGALPRVRPASVSTDLLRRDFTINAIAYDLHGAGLLDPAGGLSDLEGGTIRTLHPDSFVDDPTRIFRAIRFTNRLQFTLEERTSDSLESAVESGALHTISTDRVWHEVTRCMEEPDTPALFAALIRLNVLPNWLGTETDDPSVEQRLEVLDRLLRGSMELDLEILYLAVIIDAMRSRSVPPRLPLSRRRYDLLSSLLERTELRRNAWRRLDQDHERAGFCLAHKSEEILFLALEEPDSEQVVTICRAVREQDLPFSGSDLGVPPGPHIGRALEEARVKAWLENPTAEDLLSFARRAALRYLSKQ